MHTSKLCDITFACVYSWISGIYCLLITSDEQVNVAISARDNYCVEVILRCLAVEGDGLGLYERNDGGILATVMAAGFKGIKI